MQAKLECSRTAILNFLKISAPFILLKVIEDFSKS